MLTRRVLTHRVVTHRGLTHRVLTYTLHCVFTLFGVSCRDNFSSLPVKLTNEKICASWTLGIISPGDNVGKTTLQEGAHLVISGREITPANPMKNHVCKWVKLGINPLIVVRGPHLVPPKWWMLSLLVDWTTLTNQFWSAYRFPFLPPQQKNITPSQVQNVLKVPWLYPIKWDIHIMESLVGGFNPFEKY